MNEPVKLEYGTLCILPSGKVYIVQSIEVSGEFAKVNLMTEDEFIARYKKPMERMHNALAKGIDNTK